ncbi:cysteine desulfurase [Shinella granuli]|uniref:Cysteine desulfurase n=2 Tax=Shinella granuli TaxID=323621 RepID=A0A4V6NL10_SHIGR|nr:cysteine desulfurase [Shinella granuli]
MSDPARERAVSSRSNAMIYLDHHATTPVDSRVVDIVTRAMLDDYGNANGVENLHGERAASIVDRSKASVASLLRSDPADVHFTSGSTEAIELALSHAIASGKAPLRVGLSTVEHKAVIDYVLRAEGLGLCTKVWLPVNDEAMLDWTAFETALHSGLDLVCVMAANNEVGTTYPITEVAAASHLFGAKILVDATQAVGRMEIDTEGDNLDYVVVSAHKVYGPKGIGALISRHFEPSHLTGLRGAHQATPNVPGIAGMGRAFEIMEMEGDEESRRLALLRDLLLRRLQALVPGLVVNGSEKDRLPHNLHVSAPGAPNDIVLLRLRGQVSVSTGSACNSGAQEPSHVLRAMGLDAARIESSLRMGLGRSTSNDDVKIAATLIADAIADVRSSLSGESYA